MSCFDLSDSLFIKMTVHLIKWQNYPRLKLLLILLQKLSVLSRSSQINTFGLAHYCWCSLPATTLLTFTSGYHILSQNLWPSLLTFNFGPCFRGRIPLGPNPCLASCKINPQFHIHLPTLTFITHPNTQIRKSISLYGLGKRWNKRKPIKPKPQNQNCKSYDKICNKRSINHGNRRLFERIIVLITPR